MKSVYHNEQYIMNTTKIIAIALLVLGILGLAYGGFSYTKETHETNIGPLKLSVKEEQRVNIPISLGIGCLLFGSLLLVLRNKF
jgi:TRAP-type C4-dicarboxylate transport system permease small subunit